MNPLHFVWVVLHCVPPQPSSVPGLEWQAWGFMILAGLLLLLRKTKKQCNKDLALLIRDLEAEEDAHARTLRELEEHTKTLENQAGYIRWLKCRLEDTNGTDRQRNSQ